MIIIIIKKGKGERKTYPSAISGSVLYGGGARWMSDGRCFFGRLRFFFLAPFNWACFAASIVKLRPTGGGEGALLGDNDVMEDDKPERGRTAVWTKAIVRGVGDPLTGADCLIGPKK